MGSLKYLLGIALTFNATSLNAAETVSHPQLGFRLTVPDGFVQTPERVQGAVVYAFQSPPAGDEKVGKIILVSRLGGVLGREKLDPQKIAAKNPQISLTTEKWKRFDIDVMRVPEQIQGIQLLTFNSHVPLKPEAIQVGVFGEARREDELRSLLQTVLSNLNGDTNWLNSEERTSRLIEGVTRLSITVAVLILIPLFVWRTVRNRRKAHSLP